MDRRTIRNRITKFTLKEEYERVFREHPELLADVTDSDLQQYAVKGEEGAPPYRSVTHGINWWYYV